MSDEVAWWARLFVLMWGGSVMLWIVIYSAVRNAIDHERDKR